MIIFIFKEINGLQTSVYELQNWQY